MEETKTLKTKVFEALGEVSMCWLPNTGNAEFDSINAERIGNQLMEEIDLEIESYKKVCYELVKNSVGKWLTVNMDKVPENFDITEFVKVSKENDVYPIQPDITLQEAIKVLQKHLSEDKSEGSYYHSWVANIGMAFYDEMERVRLDVDNTEDNKYDIHKISNQAAKNFLDLLISQ
jgi:hypothetical protein